MYNMQMLIYATIQKNSELAIARKKVIIVTESPNYLI